MDEAALVRRMLGLTITTAQARKTFPGTPASVFYAHAPVSDRGRTLTLRAAFDAARIHAERVATEARAAAQAAAFAADEAQRQAAAAGPALTYVTEVIDRELAALTASLVARAARPRAVAMVERIDGVNRRHAARACARLAARGGADDPS